MFTLPRVVGIIGRMKSVEDREKCESQIAIVTKYIEDILARAMFDRVRDLRTEMKYKYLLLKHYVVLDRTSFIAVWWFRLYQSTLINFPKYVCWDRSQHKNQFNFPK